jgi:hypothetical protein
MFPPAFLDVVRRERGQCLLGASWLVDAVDDIENSHRAQHATPSASPPAQSTDLRELGHAAQADVPP